MLVRMVRCPVATDSLLSSGDRQRISISGREFGATTGLEVDRSDEFDRRGPDLNDLVSDVGNAELANSFVFPDSDGSSRRFRVVDSDHYQFGDGHGSNGFW